MSKEHDLSNAIDAYLNKAKPKVLKPGSPEHTKAMAEVEATKAAKPKSTNPAGEESPSRAGSRERFGDRPLVAFDKADGLNKYEEVPTEKIGGKMGGGSKQTSRVPELPNPVSRDMRDVKKSVDLEEGSRSWSYQG